MKQIGNKVEISLPFPLLHIVVMQSAPATFD
jgi:hypothetical protein